MKHELYSEIRTIYETTTENPHTFRVTLKMKDMIEPDLLNKAVQTSIKRYPYFSVSLVVEDDKLYFEDNEHPLLVLHADDPPILGSPDVNGHLLAISWWKNKIHIDVYHALTDGGGIYHFIKTLIYYYCQAYYDDVELLSEGVWLAEDDINPLEWDDPGKHAIDDELFLAVDKWQSPAFQLFDGGRASFSEPCETFNIRIPEAEFMRFNLSNDGSPGTVVALFLSRAIASVHPELTDPESELDPIVIAMCVNQRKALGSPLAHQSLVGDVRLPYHGALVTKPFMTQATCFRGMVAVQSDSDVVLQEIKDYQSIMAELDALPSHEERHEYCVNRMNRMTSFFTATISYVGKTDMGDAEQFIQEFHVLPSTALPSSATPLTLELSAINGSFYVNFMQYFEDDCYLKAFIHELRENKINYDVLYQEQTKYPGIKIPW